MVLKVASFVPQSGMRIAELWKQAGLPDGVLNLVTTSRNEAEILLRHPDIKGITSSVPPALDSIFMPRPPLTASAFRR